MKKVTDPEFRKYGRVLDLKIPDLLERLGKTPLTDEVVYVASEPSLEAAAEFDAVRDSAFGGIPIQIGYCNGKNDTLNAIEYHRCSEINIAYQGAVLIVGCQQDIEDDFTYDTERWRCSRFRRLRGRALRDHASLRALQPGKGGLPGGDCAGEGNQRGGSEGDGSPRRGPPAGCPQQMADCP